jgi:hypothetical protein
MVDGSGAEWIKFWGGLAGLVTFAFTVWDRAFRSRPWVEPHVYIEIDIRQAMFGAVIDDAAVCLRVYNPGPKAIGLGSVRFYPRTTPPLIELYDDVGREVRCRVDVPCQHLDGPDLLQHWGESFIDPSG